MNVLCLSPLQKNHEQRPEPKWTNYLSAEWHGTVIKDDGQGVCYYNRNDRLAAKMFHTVRMFWQLQSGWVDCEGRI